MKRVIRLIAFICLFMISAALIAEESDMFVKTISRIKVYQHRLGYMVMYPKGDLSTGQIYIPASWFEQAGAKGEIVWGNHPSFPFMSIFWKDGKFHHIRLYVEKNMQSMNWGVLSDSKDYSKEFNVEEIVLE